MNNTHVKRAPRGKNPVAGGDSCGCAMSARFLLVAMISSLVWYVWHRHSLLLSVGGIAVRVMVCSFGAAAAGKVAGIAAYKLETRAARFRALN
jgi:hypothetical protein